MNYRIPSSIGLPDKEPRKQSADSRGVASVVEGVSMNALRWLLVHAFEKLADLLAAVAAVVFAVVAAVAVIVVGVLVSIFAGAFVVLVGVAACVSFVVWGFSRTVESLTGGETCDEQN